MPFTPNDGVYEKISKQKCIDRNSDCIQTRNAILSDSHSHHEAVQKRYLGLIHAFIGNSLDSMSV